MIFSKEDEAFIDLLCHTLTVCKMSNYRQHADDVVAQTEHLLTMLEEKGITSIAKKVDVVFDFNKRIAQNTI